MVNDYTYEYEWDEKYCYPQSFVLINKLGITNTEDLQIAEREITSLKIAKLKDVPLKGSFDLKHLKKIHKFIFCDIYSWAGKFRTVNISKGNQFCICDYIDMYAESIFEKLKKEKYLIESPLEDIPNKLAYYLSEINVLHPFREGNGRTQRLFIEYLANVAGYEVDFSDVSDKEMIIASADSFAKDYKKLNSLLERISSPISKNEQKKAVTRFFGKNNGFII